MRIFCTADLSLKGHAEDVSIICRFLLTGGTKVDGQIAQMMLFRLYGGGNMTIQKARFGQTADAVAVDLYTLTNTQGMEALITNYGATLVSLKVPDRYGKSEDITLGYDSLEKYLQGRHYFGCIVGRYANRIAGGKFTLKGKQYTLTKNEGDNHLHGGTRGFNKVIWQLKNLIDDVAPSVILTYLSADGEEGYPGNLPVTVTYSLTEKNDLRIDYTAETDQPTVINLTHHSYFNLAGAGLGDILGHMLTIFADRFTPIDNRLIPAGELRSVNDTPLDFAQPTAIGARIAQNDEQLMLANGYDHNWVLNKEDGKLALGARVFESQSGRTMEVYTTEPGIQFYSGNFLDNRIAGKASRIYRHRGGFCLETQHFPDSPNRPEFPSVVLEPGANYQSTTIYRFSGGSA
jgi:aldose 1-epimerase